METSAMAAMSSGLGHSCAAPNEQQLALAVGDGGEDQRHAREWRRGVIVAAMALVSIGSTASA